MTTPRAGDRSSLSSYWPLFGLRLRTPRLSLSPVADTDLAELIDLILAGVHDPALMPFATPWTDAPREELVVNSLRHFWRQRSETEPHKWTLPFAVRAGTRLVGIQDLEAEHFAVTRTVGSGSWLGRADQSQGYGTEMRCAVLDFAFDHLKAVRAESAAFVDNPASLRVSEKIGYRQDGTSVYHRRPGEAAINHRLLVTPDTFIRPSWRVQVAGLDPCRPLLGL